VAFDGTGYGDDGTIWGSEIFLCGDDKDYKRIAHLKPLKLIGGNEGARNCQTMLCAYMDQAGIHGDDETAKTVAAALKNDINTVTSTSMPSEETG
jgi:Hydrogenase maturation factor